MKELFFEEPHREFHLRELARLTNKTHATIKRHLDSNITIKQQHKFYPIYKANTDNPIYKLEKQQYILKQIHKTAMLKHIQENCFPKSIILFGSCAKATFDKDSDIDIFVESHETPVNLAKFQTQLKRKINILFEPELANVPTPLATNIVNGIVLQGKIDLERLYQKWNCSKRRA